MRPEPLLALTAAVLLQAGCAPLEPGEPPATAPAPPPGAILIAQPAPQWSAAGLEDQPRMEVLRATSPADFTPGTTAWRAAAAPIPAPFRREAARAARGWATPGELLADLTRELGAARELGTNVWEITTRALPAAADRADAVVLQWGFQDDAVAGHDFRLALRRDAQGWYVERMDERLHCRRGVTAEGLCV